MSDRADSSGVRFPPPLLYAAAVAGGYLLDRRWPLPLGSGLAWRLVAWVCVAVWLLLMFGGLALFRRRHTSFIPNRPASTLVIEGPYRLTRNPMYLGMASLTVALAILLGTAWPVILLVPVLVLVRRLVIDPEEAYLTRRFGADYEQYTRQVRRWI